MNDWVLDSIWLSQVEIERAKASGINSSQFLKTCEGCICLRLTNPTKFCTIMRECGDCQRQVFKMLALKWIEYVESRN